MTGTGSLLAGSLFDDSPVYLEEVRISEDVPPPHPQEAEQVADAVKRRRLEFAAGRYCARRALARMNIENFILRNGGDRAPCWPAGVVGAITHKGRVDGPGGGGYCGVVVGRRGDVLTVGFDAEESTPLKRSLWGRVLTANERRVVEAADPQVGEVIGGLVGGLRAKVFFSAKECFYKAQYALSQRFLRFHDVEITLDDDAATFSAELTASAPAGLPLTRCRGKYLAGKDFVVTGIALKA